MLKYKKNPTLSQGGIDIGLKVGILAEIGYMLHECALLDIYSTPSSGKMYHQYLYWNIFVPYLVECTLHPFLISFSRGFVIAGLQMHF